MGRAARVHSGLMSSVQRTGYESARPTHVCAATGRALEAGERYVAVLTESPESEELVRSDYTLGAWEAGHRPGRPVLAVWRATEGDRRRGAAEVMSTEEMLALFESMEAAEGGRAAVFRYLLALLLLRKRVYRVVDQRVGEQGRPVLQLVRRGGQQGIEPEVVEVVDPGMDEEAVAAGIEELGAVLAGAEPQGGGA